eukprot:TRINITY_DN117049_c0_g1_i1.p1 TRINITY_DN117049_c0_g1~~TRINITY_DN117049_c0_g1_i1.p1  ORF type:complete len:345 (-),score=49.17 TRINITY_DN117049_c0_g1_i1:195-1157(-)
MSMMNIFGMLNCCSAAEGGTEVQQMPIWKGGQQGWVAGSDGNKKYDLDGKDDAPGANGFHGQERGQENIDDLNTRMLGTSWDSKAPQQLPPRPGMPPQTFHSAHVTMGMDMQPPMVIEDENFPQQPCCVFCCSNNRSPAANTYTLELDRRAGQDVGVTVDVQDPNRCVISSVSSGGILDAWNRQAPSTHVVTPGDVVLEINGKGGTAEEVSSKLLHMPCHMRLVIQRPHTQSVQLQKQGRPLGLSIAPTDPYNKHAFGLMVKELTSGAVQSWNASVQNYRNRVNPGSRIVSINGASNLKGMLDVLNSGIEFVDMKIVSYP